MKHRQSHGYGLKEPSGRAVVGVKSGLSPENPSKLSQATEVAQRLHSVFGIGRLVPPRSIRSLRRRTGCLLGSRVPVVASANGWQASRRQPEDVMGARHLPRSATRRTSQVSTRARTIVSSNTSASSVPSASPFSKSSPDCPMVFVTCARQSNRTPAALAKV